MFKTVLQSLTGAILAVALISAPAHATSGSGTANLSLAPTSGSYSTGSTFTVNVNETSAGPVAGVEADFHYDAAKLECLGVSASGSAFAQQYQNSCGGGMIYIARTTQGTTVTGTQKIASVSFKVLASGSTAITAAGTSEILDNTVNNVCGNTCAEGAQVASYTLTAPAAPAPTPTPQPTANQPSTSTSTAAKPEVKSATQDSVEPTDPGVVAASQTTVESEQVDTPQSQKTQTTSSTPSALLWVVPAAVVAAAISAIAMRKQDMAQSKLAATKPEAKKTTAKSPAKKTKRAPVKKTTKRSRASAKKS